MSTTIMTRPYVPVTTCGDEPEPQHDRDTSNPDSMPPLPRRNRVVVRPACSFGFTANDDGDSGQADEALRRVRTGR